MHGRFDKSDETTDQSITRSFGIGIVVLPLLLVAFLVGLAIAKPDVSRLEGSTVHFRDGTSEDFDVMINATGYNITFPFFDEAFLSAPDNRLPLYKRMLKPGIDDLAFIGLGDPFADKRIMMAGEILVDEMGVLPAIGDQRAPMAG